MLHREWGHLPWNDLKTEARISCYCCCFCCCWKGQLYTHLWAKNAVEEAGNFLSCRYLRGIPLLLQLPVSSSLLLLPPLAPVAARNQTWMNDARHRSGTIQGPSPPRSQRAHFAGPPLSETCFPRQQAFFWPKRYWSIVTLLHRLPRISSLSPSDLVSGCCLESRSVGGEVQLMCWQASLGRLSFTLCNGGGEAVEAGGGIVSKG